MERLDLWLETFRDLVVNGVWPRGLRHGAKGVGTDSCGKEFGFVWFRGTACVCAQSPRGNVRPTSASDPHSYASPLCAPCLSFQHSCFLVIVHT